MSAELDAKWRELVEAGRAEWAPGMLGPDGFRVLAVRQDSRGFKLVSRGCGWTAPSLQSDFLPDWNDPATLGALLGQARQRWRDAGASVWHDRRVGLWAWMAGGCIHGVWRPDNADGYDTEPGAILAMLEAAPGRPLRRS